MTLDAHFPASLLHALKDPVKEENQQVVKRYQRLQATGLYQRPMELNVELDPTLKISRVLLLEKSLFVAQTGYLQIIGLSDGPSRTAKKPFDRAHRHWISGAMPCASREPSGTGGGRARRHWISEIGVAVDAFAIREYVDSLAQRYKFLVHQRLLQIPPAA